MWLLPIINRVSSLALDVFYRTEVSGAPVPDRGPVLLVANHPNSLIDPAAVAAAADRPVRFLAKAPLFTDPLVGWLVRASGAIPVYRRVDDPAQVERNDDTFRAAHAALAHGDAVGIFPEGLSHSEPGLAPLRTGAARIALGAATMLGGSFPIVPIGLSFRDKTSFRSDALLLLGRTIAWDDLQAVGTEPEAVRELTARIERGLREVTLNLESWEDAPLVEAAEEIWAAEIGAHTPGPAAGGSRAVKIERMAQVGEALRALRSSDRADWRELAESVAAHDRTLRRLAIGPDQLGSPLAATAVRWVPTQIAWLAALGIPGMIGMVAYYAPYRLTGLIASLARPPHDVRATYKLLAGAAVHGAWTALLAVIVGLSLGTLAGVAVLLLLPAFGLTALALADRWRRAHGEARRFFVRARRRELVEELRRRQTALAARMEALRRSLSAPTAAPSDGPGGEDAITPIPSRPPAP